MSAEAGSDGGPLVLLPLTEDRADDGRWRWVCRRRGASGPVPPLLVGLRGERGPIEVELTACHERPPAAAGGETGWWIEGRARLEDGAKTPPGVIALTTPGAPRLARGAELSLEWAPASDRGRGSMAAAVRDGDPAVLCVRRSRLPVTLFAPTPAGPPRSIRALTVRCRPAVWLVPGLIVQLERQHAIVATSIVSRLHTDA